MYVTSLKLYQAKKNETKLQTAHQCRVFVSVYKHQQQFQTEPMWKCAIKDWNGKHTVH